MSEGLDVNTPRGQYFREQEEILIRILEKRWRVLVVQTPKREAAACDGFFVGVDNFEIRAVFEDKCRELSYEQFVQAGEIIINESKIRKGVQLSRLLTVPFFVVVYLIHDGSIVFWKITDHKGSELLNLRTEKRMTNASCNGGKAERLNAFLPVNKSTELKKKEE